MLNGLSLFSGVAGIELGLKEWVTTKAYCEIDPYACAVLRSRMQDGQLDKGIIYGDIKQLTGKQVISECGAIDIITGGFPCQDISNAGKRKGIKAERSGLWFEMARLTSEIRPRFLFVENVAAIINRGLSDVLGSLAQVGYDAVWTTLRASDVGAPHRRERFFMLAYPVRDGYDRENGKATREQERGLPAEPADYDKAPRAESASGVQQSGNKTDVPYSEEERCGGRKNTNRVHGESMAEYQAQEQSILRGEAQGRHRNTGNWWLQDPAELPPEAESFMGRVVDGIPNRVDRIKCLGNAVVPLQAREAFKMLIETRRELTGGENDKIPIPSVKGEVRPKEPNRIKKV